MTLYCENAAAAEVLFSLTGGREGRIVSYNPPIEITTAPGLLCKVFTKSTVTWSGDPNEDVSIDFTDIDTVFLEIPNTSVSGYILSGKFQSSYLSYQTTQEYKQFPPDGQLLYKRTLERTDTRTNQKSIIYVSPWAQFFSEEYLRILKKLPNPLLISDKEGVLYAQNFPDGLKPTYRVNCISCSSGLTAIRGEGEKIACIDAPKVISGINQANSKLREIYGN